jgi:hypothetical protein
MEESEMKIYVIYLLTMEDSPEVTIKCVTTNGYIAEREFDRARKEEMDYNEDQDEDSGNWAEAYIKTFDGISPAYGRGSLVYVTVETAWAEEVSTTLHLNGTEPSAMDYVNLRKKILIKDDPNLVPYDEDETLEESMHICNPDVMSDYYFSIEPITII